MVRQNAVERAVRAGPSPVTTRQPLIWTVTGGNGRRPAANAKRSEPRNRAGQLTGPRGIFGSSHSAAAKRRTAGGSPIVTPRGKIKPGANRGMATVRLITTLVSAGLSRHKATPASARPPGRGAAPTPPAAAEWPAATWLPQPASVIRAPTATAASAARLAAPSARIRRTIILTSTLRRCRAALVPPVRFMPRGCPVRGLQGFDGRQAQPVPSGWAWR